MIKKQQLELLSEMLSLNWYKDIILMMINTLLNIYI